MRVPVRPMSLCAALLPVRARAEGHTDQVTGVDSFEEEVCSWRVPEAPVGNGAAHVSARRCPPNVLACLPHQWPLANALLRRGLACNERMREARPHGWWVLDRRGRRGWPGRCGASGRLLSTALRIGGGHDRACTRLHPRHELRLRPQRAQARLLTPASAERCAPTFSAREAREMAQPDSVALVAS